MGWLLKAHCNPLGCGLFEKINHAYCYSGIRNTSQLAWKKSFLLGISRRPNFFICAFSHFKEILFFLYFQCLESKADGKLSSHIILLILQPKLMHVKQKLPKSKSLTPTSVVNRMLFPFTSWWIVLLLGVLAPGAGPERSPCLWALNLGMSEASPRPTSRLRSGEENLTATA